jgi:hypothetical protein
VQNDAGGDNERAEPESQGIAPLVEPDDSCGQSVRPLICEIPRAGMAMVSLYYNV